MTLRLPFRHYFQARHNRNRAWRPEWLPNWIALSSESSVHPHDPVEQADEFLAFNAASTEIEVLNWLYSTILLLKPRSILETGAADGLGTIALASACKANGFGCVHSIELDSEICANAKELAKQAGLSKWIQHHCEDSLMFLRETSNKFEFGFFDSLCEIRGEECSICMERGILRGPAVFHDTSPYRTRTMKSWPAEPLHLKFRATLEELANRHFNGNIWETTLSRGLTVLAPRRFPVE